MEEMGKNVPPQMSKLDKPWYSAMHIRHKIRFAISGLIMLFGFSDLLLSILGRSSYLPWPHDLILIWGGFSLLITTIWLAKGAKDA